MQQEKSHQHFKMLQNDDSAANSCVELLNNLELAEIGFAAVTDETNEAAENSSIETENNKQIFPHEIQLKIVNSIIDPKTLLSCRLVNWDWNTAANQKIAELNLAHWKTWFPEPENLEAPQKCRPSTILYHKKKKDYAYICVPAALKNLPLGFIFTGDSLTISSNPNAEFWEKIFFQDSIRFDQFFISFGSCLTTLTLFEVNTECYYIHSIVVNTPNLKALTFERIQHLEEKCLSNPCRKMGTQIESISKHLKYLRIYGECPELWVQWILVLVGAQLVHLTLNGFRPALLSFCRKQFVNLKQLKIYNAVLEEFFVVVGAHFAPVLEYLVIRLDYNEPAEYHNVAKFIACVRTKLKHLCLNVEPQEFMKYIDKWRMQRTTFPKLISLILQASAKGEEMWKETSKTEDVLKTMPNIKTVKFVSFPKPLQN